MTKVLWSNVQDVNSWSPDPETGSFTFKKPKVHPYYLTSAPWRVVCGHMPPLDRNLILFRLGKAIGIIK